jgi:hypothetical protein
MKKDGLNRREMLAGAASVAVAVSLPLPIARPEFVSAHAQFMETWTAYEQAREAAYVARPRIMALVRQTDISAFFKSHEIRMRARTRSLAHVAASRVYVPEAANDAEAAMQEEVIRICETMLGMDGGLRDRYPPTRRRHI